MVCKAGSRGPEGLSDPKGQESMSLPVVGTERANGRQKGGALRGDIDGFTPRESEGDRWDRMVDRSTARRTGGRSAEGREEGRAVDQATRTGSGVIPRVRVEEIGGPRWQSSPKATGVKGKNTEGDNKTHMHW